MRIINSNIVLAALVLSFIAGELLLIVLLLILEASTMCSHKSTGIPAAHLVVPALRRKIQLQDARKVVARMVE